MLEQQQVQAVAAKAVVICNVQHLKLVGLTALGLAVRAVLDQGGLRTATAHVVQDHLHSTQHSTARQRVSTPGRSIASCSSNQLYVHVCTYDRTVGPPLFPAAITTRSF
jgi:hypothetical protein